MLLIFGLQWLRKAILRASGLKALHDEDAIYAAELAAARPRPAGRRGMVADWYSFTLSFKGVVLEGLEVVFIALTFGANQHNIPLAAVAALAAVLVVTIAGIAVRAPLARVPENAMKFVVGIMLTSFGIFWGAEGAGRGVARRGRRAAAHRPRGGGVRPRARGVVAAGHRGARDHRTGGRWAGGVVNRIKAFGGFWYEFIVGDDWRVAVAVVAALAITAGVATTAVPAWWVLPATVAILLPLSLWRVARTRRARQPPAPTVEDVDRLPTRAV